MTADSDDALPLRDDDERDQAAEHEDDSLLDRLRGTGVGVEDPDIVGDPSPGPVDAEIAEDEPPQV